MSEAKNPQHTPHTTVDSYSGYAGLPPLAGLQSMREAITTGLPSFLFAALLTLAGTQRFKASFLGREAAHG